MNDAQNQKTESHNKWQGQKAAHASLFNQAHFSRTGQDSGEECSAAQCWESHETLDSPSSYVSATVHGSLTAHSRTVEEII